MVFARDTGIVPSTDRTGTVRILLIFLSGDVCHDQDQLSPLVVVYHHRNGERVETGRFSA